MNARAQQALKQLLEGNERFRTSQNAHHRYADHHRAILAASQQPIAAVVACVDSRVVPEVIFDQPLGRLFVSRVPANVASDSAKWMIDIAVGDFDVPLILVLGHTGCLALKQVMDGKTGPGGLLRFKVQSAVFRAQMQRSEDLYLEAIKQNALQTIEHLHEESWAFRDALRSGRTAAVAGVYDMVTGEVQMLEASLVHTGSRSQG